MKFVKIVRVSVGEQAVTASVLLESSNHRSLMLRLDAPLCVGPGFYVEFLPVLLDDDGVYRDLVSGGDVQIVWDQPMPRSAQ